jgi:2-keto-4-pentenoate hydratase/2-oxohepta-3-ene-1,7-dioic acid hydratase in catechol pathway
VRRPDDRRRRIEAAGDHACQPVDHVHGTGNDFSARDLQYLTTQFMIGKTFDGFAPLGPHYRHFGFAWEPVS